MLGVVGVAGVAGVAGVVGLGEPLSFELFALSLLSVGLSTAGIDGKEFKNSPVGGFGTGGGITAPKLLQS